MYLTSLLLNDYLCLLSPSLMGLYRDVKISKSYAEEHGSTLKLSKSQFIYIGACSNNIWNKQLKKLKRTNTHPIC